MARPPLDVTVHQIRITLSLREVDDDDLIAFLSDLPFRGRSVAVKEMLRKGLQVKTKITQIDT